MHLYNTEINSYNNWSVVDRDTPIPSPPKAVTMCQSTFGCLYDLDTLQVMLLTNTTKPAKQKTLTNRFKITFET